MHNNKEIVERVYSKTTMHGGRLKQEGSAAKIACYYCLERAGLIGRFPRSSIVRMVVCRSRK